MRRFFPKLICAGLAFTLLLGLAACSGGSEDTPPQAADSTSPATSEPEGNTEDTSLELEEALPDQGLAFKTATDSVTGETIALGDTKERIDGIFGEGEESGNVPDYYLYLGEKLKVKYIDGQAALINIYMLDRFSIPGFDTKMEEKEILKSFHLYETDEDNKTYQAYYDLGDNPVNSADPHFIVSVAYENGAYKSIAIVNQILLSNQ